MTPVVVPGMVNKGKVSCEVSISMSGIGCSYLEGRLPVDLKARNDRCPCPGSFGCLSEPIFKQYGCLEKRAIVPQKCFATGPPSFSAVPIVPLLVPDHVSIDDALKRSILRR